MSYTYILFLLSYGHTKLRIEVGACIIPSTDVAHLCKILYDVFVKQVETGRNSVDFAISCNATKDIILYIMDQKHMFKRRLLNYMSVGHQTPPEG